MQNNIDIIIHQFQTDYKLGGCFQAGSRKSKYYEDWLRTTLTQLSQQREDELREVYREQFEALKKNHAKVIKNCPKHPQGAGGCSFCSTNSLLKVIYGGNLRELKALSQTRGINISDKK